MPKRQHPTLPRRQWLQWLAASAALPALGAVAATPMRSPPPPTAATAAATDWKTFARQFMQPDGRIVSDDGSKSSTYSEGQSYALFFALVANDRTSFDSVLRWTRDNLSQGDLGQNLPAWLWGRKDDGSWGVLDGNAASDADLWIAYVLLQAGRLWRHRPYTAQGAALAQLILQKESAELPGLGLNLLPGPVGFVLEPEQRWRLNPSYVPLQVLHGLATDLPAQRWRSMADGSLDMLVRSAPNGISPDWTLYDRKAGFLPDETGEEKGRGGYNAIRTYLWAGMLHPKAPGRERLLQALAPMAAIVERDNAPPEHIHPLTLQTSGPGPSGFSAAMLPFLQAEGATQALEAQRQRLVTQPLRPTAYYEQCLAMFGLGWMRGDYAFTASGQLQLPWHKG